VFVLLNALCMLLPVAGISDQIHRAAPNLCRLSISQPRAPRTVLFKLKIDHLFDRLLNGPRYGFSIGPVAKVTYSSLFQVGATAFWHRTWKRQTDVVFTLYP